MIGFTTSSISTRVAAILPVSIASAAIAIAPTAASSGATTAPPPQERGGEAGPPPEDVVIIVEPEDRPVVGDPIRFYQVQIQDGFGREVLDRVQSVGLPTTWRQAERSGRMRNFETINSPRPSPHRGGVRDDVDVYRLLEASIWTYAETQRPPLLQQIDQGSLRVARGLEPNGYINTFHSLRRPDRRFEDFANGFELHSIGALFEAAAARYEVDGDRVLFDIANRAARLIDREFGPHGRSDVCGNPLIELGLMRLHGVTGEQSHLDLAKWFIDQRGKTAGRSSLGASAQDHQPLREQSELSGRVVGAMYLMAAAADLARELNDEALTTALLRLWDDLVDDKLLVTGALAASPRTGEFVSRDALHPDDAYGEIEAAIALAIWAQRMNLLTLDAKYVDVMEQAFFNAVLAGMSLDGGHFFAASPLASRGAMRRSSQLEPATAMATLTRHIASMRDHLYVRTAGRRGGYTVFVNHYIPSQATFSFGRTTVRLMQRSGYPWDGRIRLWVAGGSTRGHSIALRIPAWAESFTITIDGEAVEPKIDRGYAILEGPWKAEQTIELHLPMPVRIVESPGGRSEGRFALARGPLVYCVEAAGSVAELRELTFDRDQPFGLSVRDHDPEGDPLHAMVTIMATAHRFDADGSSESIDVEAIPYFAWANQAPGAMIVWLPMDPSNADPRPIAGMTPSASIVSDVDPLVALHDGLAPEADDPESWSVHRPRFTWWPQRGSWEWVAYDFDEPRTVRAIELFWHSDIDENGPFAPPRSLRLLARIDSSWTTIKEIPIQPDGPDPNGALVTRATFDAVETDGLRLEVRLQEGLSAGIIEWRVLDAEK